MLELSDSYYKKNNKYVKVPVEKIEHIQEQKGNVSTEMEIFKKIIKRKC